MHETILSVAVLVVILMACVGSLLAVALNPYPRFWWMGQFVGVNYAGWKKSNRSLRLLAGILGEAASLIGVQDTADMESERQRVLEWILAGLVSIGKMAAAGPRYPWAAVLERRPEGWRFLASWPYGREDLDSIVLAHGTDFDRACKEPEPAGPLEVASRGGGPAASREAWLNMAPIRVRGESVSLLLVESWGGALTNDDLDMVRYVAVAAGLVLSLSSGGS